MKQLSQKFFLISVILMVFIPSNVKVFQDGTLGLQLTSVKAATLNGWVQSGGYWYYYVNGVKQTGWKLINSKWYYFDSSGVMKTGWQLINSKWYYFDSSGAMLIGWQLINNKWYYLDSSGAMQTGWITLNDQTYYLSSSGAMVTGWQYIEDNRKWFEFNTSGQLVKKQGWQMLNGRQVYYDLDDYGLLTNRWYYVDNQWCEFDYNGYLVVVPNDNVTLGELENTLLTYFSQNNMSYKVGTPEYSEYLVKQLDEHEDPKLARHPQYTLILAYAAEYLNEQTIEQSQALDSQAQISTSLNQKTMVNSQENIKPKFNMNKVAYKTIHQIKEEIKLEEEQVNQEIKNKKNFKLKSSVNDSGSIKTLGEANPYPYDASAAVNYALKWALDRNNQYNDYDLLGSDCTNFVSQVVYAGGKAMVSPTILFQTPDIVDNGNYWFTQKVTYPDGSRKFKSSLSWVNVEAFYKYWAPRVNYVEKTWSPMQIYYDARPGDVLQYEYAGSGRKWHSLFVSGKDTNLRTLYISQHVTDRKNYDYGKIDKDKHGDSKWVYLRFTEN